MRRLLLIFGGVAALALAASAYAAFFSRTTTPSNSFTANSSFCVSPGTQTVNPDADAWVSEQNKNTNHGSTSPLDVDPSTSKARRTYLHFALPAIPHNCSVTGVTLRLNNVTLVAGRTIEVYVASGTWVETTITWNTQPGYTGGAATATTASGWMSWTVTSEVQSLYSGTDTGLVLRDSTEEASAGALNEFASREAGSNKPELQVTFG